MLFELYDLVAGIKLAPTGIEHIPEDLPFETWRKALDILNVLAATYPIIRRGWGYGFIMPVLLAALDWAIIHQRGLRFSYPISIVATLFLPHF